MVDETDCVNRKGTKSQSMVREMGCFCRESQGDPDGRYNEISESLVIQTRRLDKSVVTRQRFRWIWLFL